MDSPPGDKCAAKRDTPALSPSEILSMARAVSRFGGPLLPNVSPPLYSLVLGGEEDSCPIASLTWTSGHLSLLTHTRISVYNVSGGIINDGVWLFFLNLIFSMTIGMILMCEHLIKWAISEN